MILRRLEDMAGVWQTLYIMKDYVNRYIFNKEIKDFVSKLILPISPNDEIEIAKVIFDYIKANMKYVRDINNVEELQNPYHIFRKLIKGEAYGDCDDMAMISALMYKVVGFKTRFAVLSIGKDRVYNHVRTEILINGKYLPIELSSYKKFGEGYKSNLSPVYLNV